MVHAGDAQAATTGTAVPDPVQVRVTGRTGAALAGVSVTFAVTAGGGSIERANATTDANGIASPGRWTLGPPGPQQMRGDVLGVAPVVISATATGAPAEIAAVAGADQAVAAGSAVPVRPEVLVTDAGGEPLQGVRVTFVTERDAAVTGAEVITAASGQARGRRLDPRNLRRLLLAGGEAGRSRHQGQTRSASRRVRCRVRRPNWSPSRATASRPRRSCRSPFRPGCGCWTRMAMRCPARRWALARTGGSVAIPPRRDTDEDGFVAVDKWVLGDAAGVSYRLVVTVLDASVPPVTFTATATEAVYDIVIVHASPDLLSEGQRTAFEKAEAFWERAITGNLFWSTLRQHSLQSCLARNGFDLAVSGDRVVDDLLIYADIREIDGRGGVFGGAGPCQIRADSGLPVVGTMYFDLVDMEGLEEKGQLDGTILHEMAHVIGFGAMWEHLGLLKEPAGTPGADPHFVGPEALKAFREIGGANYTLSKPVPVESVGGPGVWNGHWREFVFRTELMTSFIDSGLNPLSIVTLASMTDMGYTGVDMSLADEFMLPAATAADAMQPGSRVDLGDDIIRGPVAVVEQDGTVVGYVTLKGHSHQPRPER